jgi:hypothetical protein
MINKNVIYIILIVLIEIGILSAFDEETKKNMPFVSSKSFCLECHNTSETKRLANPSKSCSTYCLTCHKDKKENHHKIGIRTKHSPPLDLEYTERGRIACYTCHNLNNNRYDSESWKSQSIFESTFRKQSKYKTYYLVLKNNNGQLCDKCH